MKDDRLSLERRNALKCLAYGGAGTLFALSGGILTPIDLASAAARDTAGAGLGKPLFVQLSDSHIGFNKEANPDVEGSLTQAIDLVNGLAVQPALIIHTGDITHLSRAAEFDRAQQLFSRLRTTEMHTVPGEHDTIDAGAAEYFARFGKASDNRGYYAFDHAGVHFIGLVNVMNFKPGGLGALGEEQLVWVENDLKGRSSSTPIVVFAHMPLWSIYEPWGWGTEDAPRLMAALRRFGSVTVLNGHIHQIVQKVEGNVTFHTARATAYPQPAAGVGAGPGPLKVPGEELPGMLGYSRVSLTEHPRSLALTDVTLEGAPKAAAAAATGAVAGTAAPASAGAHVDIKDFMFVPMSLTVKAGSTVTWNNFDEEPHTVTSDTGAFRSGAMDTKESFSFKFDAPGTYHFTCSIHPRMVGTIVVQ